MQKTPCVSKAFSLPGLSNSDRRAVVVLSGKGYYFIHDITITVDVNVFVAVSVKVADGSVTVMLIDCVITVYFCEVRDVRIGFAFMTIW